MHDPIRTHHLPTKYLPDALVTQTNTKNWKNATQLRYHIK